MSGILYGVGVGPGDPELMTLKAVRLIRENEVIALPGSIARETIAYQIAVQAVPELKDKTLLPLFLPMIMDREEMKKSHIEAANQIESFLLKGQNVVFLTLGDSTIYSTYLYIQKHIAERGYETQLVSGITSFSASAASSNTPLAEWNEPLYILPAVHHMKEPLSAPGNLVLMKSGKKMSQIKQLLCESGKKVVMVENCGMASEKIYRNIEDIPDDAGYYSLIIAKD